MNNFILNVNAGGIFSKFMFVIQNLQKINPDFEYVYVNNIDIRSRIGDENIFDSILEQEFNQNLPKMNCDNISTYNNFSKIESSVFLQNYKKIVKKLKFNHKLIEKFEYYENKYKIDENCLGVHIRLCDMNIIHRNIHGNVTYDDFLKHIIQEKGCNTRIFLSSDNNESIEKLKKEFGDDILYNENFLRGETEDENTTHLQLKNFKETRFWEEAFIDMLLLSKCGSLICRTSNLNNVSIIYSNSIRKITRL